MSYEEAFDLNVGDKVTVISTKEDHTIEAISGTLIHLFILLDNGHEYEHSELRRAV